VDLVTATPLLLYLTSIGSWRSSNAICSLINDDSRDSVGHDWKWDLYTSVYKYVYV